MKYGEHSWPSWSKAFDLRSNFVKKRGFDSLRMHLYLFNVYVTYCNKLLYCCCV